MKLEMLLEKVLEEAISDETIKFLEDWTLIKTADPLKRIMPKIAKELRPFKPDRSVKERHKRRFFK